MVDKSDVKFYKSSNNSLGGAITATEIKSSNPNNMFGNVTRAAQVAGSDDYNCFYVKNTHQSESMDKFNFWLNADTVPTDTTVKWGFDTSNLGTGYRWPPFFTSTGSNTDETTDAAQYDLNNFTCCGWFKTPSAPTPDEGFIVNKGGTGSETGGENLNYGLWMTNTGAITGGFEETAGTDHLATSPLATYDDGAWHFALVYYDGVNVKLFVDNMTTAVATHATTTTPETNAKPIRINQNSRASSGWFPNGATLDEIRVWGRALTDVDERYALYKRNVVNETDLVLNKNFGTNTFNLVAQEIASVGVAPTGVTWITAGFEPTIPNVGTLLAGKSFPIWVWWHTDANAEGRKDDAASFQFSLEIPSGGSGTPGGGTGGETSLDTFGIKKIYPTASGGRTYESNWHLSTTTTHQWDSAAQTYGQLDPQDSMADLIAPTTCRAKVDADQDILIAETNTDKNSWRYYIKDSAATETSSPWKWSESTEVTVYYKAVKDFPGGNIQVHCRVMGPTEHWIGISHCGGAGHEYGYEIKKNGVNQFRKEVVHVGGTAGGYAENIIFPDTNAPYGQWIGMKLVTQLKSATSMKVEAWKDLTDGLNGGNWIKAGSIVDDGTNWELPSSEAIANYNGLPAGTGNCVKPSPMNAALTMDCTAIGLRVDNTQTQFKKFSIREIDPADPGSGGGPVEPPPPGGGGGGGNPPPVNTDYKIAISGDWGCEGTTDDVIDLINSNGYDLVVGVGDNAYASAGCWTNRFKALKDAGKLTSAYGNHEYSESGGIGPYKTFFGHSKTYFTKKFQNILFIVIDTNINLDAGSAQHDFVKQQLEAAHNDASIKWKVAVMHHPWFGASSDHGNNEFNQVQAFHQLFMQHGVAFVCVGHNHNWQRTKQVAFKSTNPSSPTALSTSSPYTVTTSGFIHVVTGTGGHDPSDKLYSLGSQPSFQAYQNRTHNGVWEILATNNGLTWTCSFVEIGGDKFDTFIINAA